MRLDELVAWYQKKIGTYDKQQWEKTIEQKILAGINHLPLKHTKLKPELIDVDLVRGSTFPKAKSKLSILTVVYLAAVRLVLLPIYARWWVHQTSPKVFVVLLSIYVLQLVNVGIYSYNVNGAESGTQTVDHIVSNSDFLIPIALSLLLSVIHAQIVATASSSNGLMCHKLLKCQSLSANKRRERMRRKRRTRAQSETSSVKTPSDERLKGLASGSKSATSSPIRTAPKRGGSPVGKATSPVTIFVDPANDVERPRSNVSKENDMLELGREFAAGSELTGECSSTVLRRRNWNPVLSAKRATLEPIIDDDGFESLNGKSSGGEDSAMNARSPIEKQYYQKLPFTSNWISGCAADKDHKSESDTETVKSSAPSRLVSECLDAMAQLFKPRQHLSSESGGEMQQPNNRSKPSREQDGTKTSEPEDKHESSGDTDEENDFDLLHASHAHHHHLHHHHHHHHPHQRMHSLSHHQHLIEGDDCSYDSEVDNSDTQNEHSDDEYELEDAPTIILNPPCGASDRVSCTIWDAREAKKADMSVLDISSAIIERVEAMPESCDYVYIGLVLSIILSLVPAYCRLCEATVDTANATEVNYLEMPAMLLEKTSFSLLPILQFAFGDSTWEKTVLLLGLLLRLLLTFLMFFLLAVAERTFKQRFLYAKLFSHLTSTRRAQKSGIPHFRLNRVRNIKTWLCVRSYLKRRGPQNSVEVIVSATFIITLLLLGFLSVEWLKDSVRLHSQCNLEALAWSCAFGTFLLRFMTLGTKINKKYKSVSVLITEQINLYVQIEHTPNKKEELMISNNVLKLAADLLKELESPFKISGLSANPYLYTTVKVVILSALSGVLSEMLGFKLKLHKIKIK